MGYVEGINRDQSMIFSWDDMVASDATDRVVDRFIEISDFIKLGFAKTKPSDTGRPPYSPKILALAILIPPKESAVFQSKHLHLD